MSAKKLYLYRVEQRLRTEFGSFTAGVRSAIKREVTERWAKAEAKLKHRPYQTSFDFDRRGGAS